MKIVVIGSGYVGTTLAALLATLDHQIIALDTDSQKVSIINSGKSPFYEEGLSELIKHSIVQGNLSATQDYGSAITNADLIFSCVGTPDKPDGSSDLGYIYEVAKSCAKYIKKGVIFVQKSTVPTGTGEKVSALLPDTCHYISNPEFLREGTAIIDSLLTDRVVVGGKNKQAVQKVIELHKQTLDNTEKITTITGIQLPDKAPEYKTNFVATNLESAELIKVSANAFLALKISFANSIAKLCDETGANITEVMDGVGSDHRIGRAFLNAGRGYGGGCFPKDVSGLIASSLEYGVDMPIMTAVTEVNQSMPGYIINKAGECCSGFVDKKVTVLGLTFKAGTSDTRRSPAIEIANRLSKLGAIVNAYDPEADDEAKNELEPNITIRPTLQASLKDAQIIFIATNWPEFTIENIQQVTKDKVVIVDCMNSLDSLAVRTAGFDYIGVGTK